MIAPWQTPHGSLSVLIEAPTEEPITLDEAKLRAGLAWPTTDPPDPRDALMNDYIAAARQQVERDTGLALITQLRDLYFTVITGGLVTLPMQALPLQEVIEVVPIDPATGRALGPPRPPGAIALATQGGVTVLTAEAFAGMTASVARCKVGWMDRLALKTAAPLLVQAVGLLTAHFATTGRDAVITGTIATPNPLGYEDAIASYRLVWVP